MLITCQNVILDILGKIIKITCNLVVTVATRELKLHLASTRFLLESDICKYICYLLLLWLIFKKLVENVTKQ